MTPLVWYFDFVSPFAWFGLQRLGELPKGRTLEFRPILLAALLQHHGHKGPAEIPSKRRFMYRWVNWHAKELGVPFRFPAAHPFNPLHHLRLAIACGCRGEAVRRIFERVWTTGEDAADPAAFQRLALELGVDAARLGTPDVKDALRRNTEDAIARGVFGVPTLEIDGEFFWGADAFDFALAFLAEPRVLRNPEYERIDRLPVGAARKF